MIKKIKRKIKKYLGKNTQENISFIGSQKPNLEVGEGTYFNGIHIYCWDKRVNIKIGKYCSFADKINIVAGGEHDKDWVTTSPLIDRWKMEQYYDLKKPRYKGDIIIGNDVWVAFGATILSGVKIGDGAVVAAGSVVTKDIPPYAIVGGVPAKVIKYRFDDEIIKSLQDIKWWDWDQETIKKRVGDFTEPEVFIQKYCK